MTLGPADENIAISGAGLVGSTAVVLDILATGYLFLQKNKFSYYVISVINILLHCLDDVNMHETRAHFCETMYA